ncbi:phage portal protein [Roseibium alexandrii]|uniref:Bacteriophage capsid protein n=1 Tax=Roseibium alexandrii (strain DSM 17067 / NCIMB 14079 / DFL-11) TaxID=244592 RepID=A0A5E8GT99_ROSAD|nr:phage portal protein [Roseibium alexandrii]EEE43067.2 Bacteriophage capsid protein [Roseibium alexandrii DFL-11]
MTSTISSPRHQGSGYHTPYNDRIRQMSEGEYWAPPLRSTDGDIIGARPYTEARLKQLAQTAPFLAGAIDLICVLAIGSKAPRVQSTPNWRLIPGATEEWAETFSDRVELEWQSYISSDQNYVDSSRKHNFLAFLWQAYRSFLVNGEIAALSKIDKKQQLKNSTAIMLIDPARIKTSPTAQNKQDIRDGIEHDEQTGEVKFYHIANSNPRDSLAQKVEYVRTPPKSSTGRKLVLHHFDPVGCEQSRGISPLSPAINAVKQQMDLSESARRSAALQSGYMLAFKSKLTTEEVQAALGQVFEPDTPTDGGGYVSASSSEDPLGGLHDHVRAVQVRDATYLKGRKTGLQNMVGGPNSPAALQLLPGQEVEFLNADISSDFSPFVDVAIKEVARSMGLNLDAVSGDFSKTSYSGGTLSLALQQASTASMAARVLVPFIREIYALFVETFLMTEEGMDLLPSEVDFWSHRDAILSCTIKMGTPLSMDPVKMAKSLEIMVKNRMISLETASSRIGEDLSASLLQQKREQDTIDALGLRSLESNKNETIDEFPDDESDDAPGNRQQQDQES